MVSDFCLPLGALGVTVSDDADISNLTALGELGTEPVVVNVPGETTDKDGAGSTLSSGRGFGLDLLDGGLLDLGLALLGLRVRAVGRGGLFLLIIRVRVRVRVGIRGGGRRGGGIRVRIGRLLLLLDLLGLGHLDVLVLLVVRVRVRVRGGGIGGGRGRVRVGGLGLLLDLLGLNLLGLDLLHLGLLLILRLGVRRVGRIRRRVRGGRGGGRRRGRRGGVRVRAGGLGLLLLDFLGGDGHYE